MLAELVLPAAGVASLPPQSRQGHVPLPVATNVGVVPLIRRHELQTDDADPAKLLGEGGFGLVRAGTWLGASVAIKQLRLPRVTTEAQAELVREAGVHARLRHPHIVHLYGLVMDTPCCLVMELMAGSLHNLLNDHSKNLPWPMRARLARETGLGLEYLHTCGILHRDLKSMNVLLDAQNIAKLSDFGLARVKGETMRSQSGASGQGTLGWMAPELLMHAANHSVRTDIYAFGMTLWEICSRTLPFAQASNAQLVAFWVTIGRIEAIPDDTPATIRDIIGTATSGCWAREPSLRPSMSDILSRLKALAFD